MAVPGGKNTPKLSGGGKNLDKSRYFGKGAVGSEQVASVGSRNKFGSSPIPQRNQVIQKELAPKYEYTGRSATGSARNPGATKYSSFAEVTGSSRPVTLKDVADYDKAYGSLKSKVGADSGQRATGQVPVTKRGY